MRLETGRLHRRVRKRGIMTAPVENAWQWPQYVMASIFVLSLVGSITNGMAHERAGKSGTQYILLTWTILIVEVLVLSAGGFW